jgi:hypothetical protein
MTRVLFHAIHHPHPEQLGDLLGSRSPLPEATPPGRG